MPQVDPRKIKSPRTVNQILLDRAIRHGIYLSRLAGGEARWVAEQMPALRQAVVKEITPLLADLKPSDIISATDEAIINQAATRGSKVVQQHLERISGQSLDRLGGIAVSEAEFERRLFQKAMPIEMNFNRPSDQFLQSMMRNEPISGKTMNGWFGDMTVQTRTAINDQIRQGMVNGESINDMLRRVRGRRENGFRDGIIGRVGGNAEAIVRSGAMKASNRARQKFHQANEDVIASYSHVLTLDSATCPICVEAESRNTYPINSPPEGTLHVNCRCVVVANTKSWREMGIDMDEMEPGTRASMNGEVPDSMTYEEWFGNQDPALQMDVLGPSRFSAYQQGVDVSTFADDGRILDLEDLQAREPDIFVPGGQKHAVVQQKGQVFTDIDLHKREMDQYVQTLHPDQRESIDLYTRDAHYQLNKAMRENKPLPGGFDPIKRSLDDFIEKAPRYQGKSFRGIGMLDEQEFNKIAREAKNGYLIGRGYQSASLSKDVADAIIPSGGYEVMMNIKGKNGSWISGLSGYQREQEILYKHGTKWKVVSQSRRGKRLILNVEEI